MYFSVYFVQTVQRNLSKQSKQKLKSLIKSFTELLSMDPLSQITKTFELLQQKEKIASETIAILQNKAKFIDKLGNLSDINQNVSKRATEVHEVKDEFKKTVKEHSELNQQLMRIQFKMLSLIEFLDSKPQQQQIQSPVKKSQLPLRELTVTTPQLYKRVMAQEAFREYNTPRLTIENYAKSPMVKQRSKAHRLQFQDFEADIDREEFEKIPGYMKGRTQLCELVEFLETVVIRTFNEKYQILFKERGALSTADYNLQLMFRDQNYFDAGSKFVTIGDFCRILNKSVDKKGDRLLQMLRHLRIIKEVRHKNTTCYIWLKK